MEAKVIDRPLAGAAVQATQIAAAASEAVAELAAEAREVKARAEEAADEYRRTIRREVGRAMRRVDYARKESAYRIQQSPLASVAIACAAGFLGGAAAAWAIMRAADRACPPVGQPQR
jgi:ElaB/YqjD/DUF883 family membrane-anchored ribosome-binding protein